MTFSRDAITSSRRCWRFSRNLLRHSRPLKRLRMTTSSLTMLRAMKGKAGTAKLLFCLPQSGKRASQIFSLPFVNVSIASLPVTPSGLETCGGFRTWRKRMAAERFSFPTSSCFSCKACPSSSWSSP